MKRTTTTRTFLTTVAALTFVGSASAAPVQITVGTGEATNNFVAVGGASSVTADRDEANHFNGSGLELGDLNGKDTHQANNNANSNWRDVQTAGLLIDLGQAYDIGVMHIFNANLIGTQYSITSFDFKYATDPTAVTLAGGTDLIVNDISKFTTLTNDTPINSTPTSRNSDLLGDIFTFGNAVVPSNLGDDDQASDGVNDGTIDSLSASSITARYIFLDDAVGVTTFGGRGGFAEIRFYTYEEVPEPGSLALLGLGGLLVASRRRRG